MFSRTPASRSGPVSSSRAIEQRRSRDAGKATDPISPRIGRHFLCDEDRNHLGAIFWGGMFGFLANASGVLAQRDFHPEAGLAAAGAAIALYKAVMTFRTARLWRDEAMVLVRRHRRTIRKLQCESFRWQSAWNELAAKQTLFRSEEREGASLLAGEPAVRGSGSRRHLTAGVTDVIQGPWRV